MSPNSSQSNAIKESGSLCPKSLKEMYKRRFRGQKNSFGAGKNGLQAFFLFLFLLAMLSTDGGLRFSAVQKWLLFKKERNSKAFSFWQIHDWRDSILRQVQLSCKICWSEKLKKMYVREIWQHATQYFSIVPFTKQLKFITTYGYKKHPSMIFESRNFLERVIT